MKLRINEAIELHNYRKERANIKAKQPTHKNKLNGGLLGRMLFPKQQETTMYVSMNNLRNGKTKGVKLEQIDVICKACGVDPNFILGWPSKHDKEFNQISK